MDGWSPSSTLFLPQQWLTFLPSAFEILIVDWQSPGLGKSFKCYSKWKCGLPQFSSCFSHRRVSGSLFTSSWGQPGSHCWTPHRSWEEIMLLRATSKRNDPCARVCGVVVEKLLWSSLGVLESRGNFGGSPGILLATLVEHLSFTSFHCLQKQRPHTSL